MRTKLCLSVCLALLAIPAHAVTIHVPSEQPTIQAGIDAASAGDTVLVACGTYYEHDIVMTSGVYLTSETGQADCVTINAQEQGRVMECVSVSSSTVIEGITFTGGRASGGGGGVYCRDNSSPVLRNVTFQGNFAGGSGGGMKCYLNCSPILSDAAFSDNIADNGGGGLWVEEFCDIALTRVTFSGNQSLGDPGYVQGHGGGMHYLEHGNGVLTDVTFSGNEAVGSGGGLHCEGVQSLTMSNVIFSENVAGWNGGGLTVILFSDATGLNLDGVELLMNEAGSVGGGMAYSGDGEYAASFADVSFTGNIASDGGGLYCFSASPTLSDVVFTGNTASGAGGGLLAYSECDLVLQRVTFCGNTAVAGGGMALDYLSSATLANATFSGNAALGAWAPPWGPGGGIAVGEFCSLSAENCIVAFSTHGQAVAVPPTTSSVWLSCCDVYGNADGDWVGLIADQYGINGNFSEDPNFCDMLNDDFTLCADSPCLPEGNDCGVLIGAYGEGCGPCNGPVESTSWGAIKAMYR